MSGQLVKSIEQKIFIFRGHKVMIDRDLAELYGVPTKRLNEQVKRNQKRFPEDFMFQLTEAETKPLRSQIATLKRGQHAKYLPYAFTEQGVAMLSSVLNSDRAIDVNVQIMRVFVKLRELMMTHRDLAIRIEALEKKYEGHDEQFKFVFEAIKRLLQYSEEEKTKKTPIGFHP